MSVRTWALATAAVAAISSPAFAQATRTFDIPAQPLSSALEAFGSQSGSEILFDRRQTAGKSASAVRGAMTPSEALQRLLAGSSLSMRQVNATTFVVSPSPQVAGAEGPVSEVGEVVVTGTRIRGGSSASPTISITERQFQEEGFNDLGDVIRSIPQNFNGQSPGVGLGAGDTGNSSNGSATGGSSLNLRGLGPDATLTLLNGRRMAYDRTAQSVDIGAIPIEAVARIEIVTDGASAIYGSDAVGGVANVVLKRDFDGVTLGALYGDSADGGLTTRDYSVTAGMIWDTGGLIATYKNSNQDPIFADKRSYTEFMIDPSTLYSGSKLGSALVSAHQRLGSSVEVSVDALHTVREAIYFQGQPTFYNDIRPKTVIAAVSPNVQLTLPGDWTATASLSWSQNEHEYTSIVVRSAGSTTSVTHFDNETQGWEIGAEGPLARFGPREIRLAMGVGERREQLQIRRIASTAPNNFGAQNSRYAYGELRLPLVQVDDERPGVRRLEFSAAARMEDYNSFGQVTTPKLGVLYDPNTDFTLKASWGRSFKAPTLYQLYGISNIIFERAQRLGCSSCAPQDTALLSLGANPELDPERARTWTTTLAFHPERLPFLDVELSYFDVDYTQKIISPIPLRATSFSNPAYATLITRNPTLQQQQQVISDFSDVFSNLAGVPYDPNNVVAIISGQSTNADRQQASGVDLSGRYRTDLFHGRLELRGGISWLDMSREMFAGQGQIDLAGTLYYPAKWNGRMGAVWSRTGLSASAFLNYTSGVENTLGTTPKNTSSFTTVDATVRYETGQTGNALSDLTLAFSISNLFNTSPPTFVNPNPTYLNYDSTNYSAVGRYLTFSISKHF